MCSECREHKHENCRGLALNYLTGEDDICRCWAQHHPGWEPVQEPGNDAA